MTATALLEFKQRVIALSSDEKLQLLEVLWEEISRDDQRYASPAWHLEELAKTEARLTAGQETVHDWDEVKANLLAPLS